MVDTQTEFPALLYNYRNMRVLLMKKSLIVMLSLLILATCANAASVKNNMTPDVISAIKVYKTGDYVQSYNILNNIVSKDPSNPLAYYYLAMSAAQIGKKSEAIENYNKVIALAPSNGQLRKYANKGKVCLQDSKACHAKASEVADLNDTPEDRFIKGKSGNWTEQVRNQYETQKIQNMMREMNRDDSIVPQRFRDFKDFSSQAPTNDEIVYALRVLQSAGLSNFAIGNSGYSDLSLLGVNNNNMNNGYDAMSALLMNNNSGLNPQLIQSLLTNQMNASF